MELIQKLEILGDAAKYDVACTSSGVDRGGKREVGGIGNAVSCGLCHSFASDGRCISLLKILLTNYCIYDCKYCLNRCSNDVPRAAFTPQEIADLTINFYKRNYIEGLFLSSAVVKNPDYTMELLCRALEILRYEYKFNGYIHAKTIPGASPLLVEKLGHLADRLSVNIELPSQKSLNLLAPQKSKDAILRPMGQISSSIMQNKQELTVYRHATRFAPAGQSTQMIIGASKESDYQILSLTAGLYKKYSLKRVFFSAYVPVGTDPNLPVVDKPPLLREHRLYQADWLLRFYGFEADEILNEKSPNFDPLLDPKCNWAMKNLHLFPVDVNKAPYEMLLRVPGIGVKSAQRIRTARRVRSLDYTGLKRIGVVLKRARFFITVNGRYMDDLKISENFIMQNLLGDTKDNYIAAQNGYQLSLFDEKPPALNLGTTTQGVKNEVSAFLTEGSAKKEPERRLLHA